LEPLNTPLPVGGAGGGHQLILIKMKNRQILQIDGKEKSGSGTIVRDAALFGVLGKKNLNLINIRSKRQKPGLRPQHVKVLEAAAEICDGNLKGASVGASVIEFYPGKNIRGGYFLFDIGTAGSATMMALCIMPLGLFAQTPSTYRFVGGLFQDFAPSAFHLKYVLLPLIKKMGADIDIKIIRPGYVPKGNGILEIKILPLKKKLNPIILTNQGKIINIRGYSLASFLEKRKVSERMADEFQMHLKDSGFRIDIKILNDNKDSPVFEKASVQSGAAFAAWAQTDTGCIIGADMAGAIRRSAEFIGHYVAGNLMQDIESGACSDRFLSDQLIPFAALAKGTSKISIPAMTDHIEARLWLAEIILGAKSQTNGNLVQIEGIGYL
jgi:RNA 3'-terminal phosphate cyclase (ATP)